MTFSKIPKLELNTKSVTIPRKNVREVGKAIKEMVEIAKKGRKIVSEQTRNEYHATAF